MCVHARTHHSPVKRKTSCELEHTLLFYAFLPLHSLLFMPFHVIPPGCTERLGNLLKVTQLSNGIPLRAYELGHIYASMKEGNGTVQAEIHLFLFFPSLLSPESSLILLPLRIIIKGKKHKGRFSPLNLSVHINFTMGGLGNSKFTQEIAIAVQHKMYLSNYTHFFFFLVN